LNIFVNFVNFNIFVNFVNVVNFIIVSIIIFMKIAIIIVIWCLIKNNFIMCNFIWFKRIGFDDEYDVIINENLIF